jgi:arylformamidase
MKRYDDTDFDVEADQAELGRVLARYADLSTQAFTEHRCIKDVSYGDHPAQRLDIFLPETPVRDIVTFFHGGWWRSGTKETRAFLAPPILKAGSAFVSVEYPLAPATQLADIVESAAQAVAWVYQHFAPQSVTPPSLTFCGNSAGAHLAACVASLEGLDSIGVPAHCVQRLIGLSGLYDLAPLRPLFVKEWIDFTDRLVAGQSPMLRSYAPGLQIELYAGALEPRGFQDQTLGFAAALRDRGYAVQSGLIAGEDHLSIIPRLPEIVLGETGNGKEAGG